MGKLLKLFTWIILCVIVFIAIAAGLLVTLVKPQRFQPQIIARVQQYTGRKLAIDGPIHWTFFPLFGIEAEKVSISNPQDFAAGNFATIDNIKLVIAVRPLLSGNIRMGHLILNGMNVHLQQNSQGQNNWSSWKTTASEKITSPRENLSPAKNTVKNKLAAHFKFSAASISDVQIINSKMDFNQQIFLQKINFTGQNIGLNKSFPLTLSFMLQDAKNFGKAPVNISFNAMLLAKPDQQFVQINNLQAAVNQMHINGNLYGQYLNTQPVFTGRVEIPLFDANSWLVSLGKLQAGNINNLLRHVAARFTLTASQDKFQLNNLQAKVDGTHITGNLAKTQGRLLFDLRADELSFPPDIAAATSISPIQNANAAEITSDNDTAAGNVAFLKNLNAQGHLVINALNFRKASLALKNIDLTLNAQNGIVNIAPLKAQMDEGQLAGNMVLDARNAVLNSKSHIELNNINMGLLLNNLQALSHLNLQISGTGQVQADMTAEGIHQADIIKTLAGSGKFMMQNGILHGIDIPYYSNLADAIANKAAPTKKDTKQTPFGEMTGTVQIAGGIASSQDLKISAPQMLVTGSGTADLRREQVNYVLQLQRLTSGTEAKPRGPAIPIAITGPFANPSIRPDWAALAVSQITTQMGDKLQDQIQKHLGDSPAAQKIQQGLQSLLGN